MSFYQIIVSKIVCKKAIFSLKIKDYKNVAKACDAFTNVTFVDTECAKECNLQCTLYRYDYLLVLLLKFTSTVN